VAWLGLIAGGGRFPQLVAQAARGKGYQVIAVAHLGETDPSLAEAVDRLEWVRLGQLERIATLLRAAGASQAVMAGGIGRVRALSAVRPDLGAVRVLAKLRSFRDDALLRGIAAYLGERGVELLAPTAIVPEVLAPEGHLAGPTPDEALWQDVALGLEVAGLIGQADVGQTVVVRNRQVLAVEAVEGTDEAIRRGGRLGGPGAVVIKRCKPGQDERFDLPAVGAQTLTVMKEVGARALAVEAGRSVLLDAGALFARAQELRICVLGVRAPSSARR
jgi:UDP-2,3-diacylglucosamine hydrolase